MIFIKPNYNFEGLFSEFVIENDLKLNLQCAKYGNRLVREQLSDQDKFRNFSDLKNLISQNFDIFSLGECCLSFGYLRTYTESEKAARSPIKVIKALQNSANILNNPISKVKIFLPNFQNFFQTQRNHIGLNLMKNELLQDSRQIKALKSLPDADDEQIFTLQ